MINTVTDPVTQAEWKLAGLCAGCGDVRDWPYVSKPAPAPDRMCYRCWSLWWYLYRV